MLHNEHFCGQSHPHSDMEKDDEIKAPPASDRISAHDPSYTQAIGFYTTCLKEDTWQISQRSVETATICSKISVKKKKTHME